MLEGDIGGLGVPSWVWEQWEAGAGLWGGEKWEMVAAVREWLCLLCVRAGEREVGVIYGGNVVGGLGLYGRWMG